MCVDKGELVQAAWAWVGVRSVLALSSVYIWVVLLVMLDT